MAEAKENMLMNRERHSLEAIQAEHCRNDFHFYIQKAWKIVEPGKNFVDNWHIGLICETLEAVTRGEVQNLIINIPPRHMKSLLVSVFWPTWMWTHSPEVRWLTGSYSELLATRDALKSRRIIQSAWYQQLFGDVFQLRSDQNMKNRYENDQTGYRLAFSLGGALTGEGGDIIVVDDPLKAQDADSEVMRERANEIYDGTVSTRGNDPKTTRRVIIMQRLHENDLTGHILEKMKEEGANQYEHICLPTEYEANRFYSSIGLSDPRESAGSLLWPKRFGEKENSAAKVDLGARGYAGQHGQRPGPQGGNIYQVEWWRNGRNRYRYADVEKEVIARWLSWDTAFKDGADNDTSALTVWELLADYHLILRQASWHRLQFPQLASAIEEEAWRWMYDGKLRGIVIEDKASGISALQTIGQSAKAEICCLLVAFQPGQTSKAGRARQASLWCERDCVWLPEPSKDVPWLFDFEDQLYKFPAARVKDAVDSMGQAILFLENLLAEGGRARGRGGDG
jgi:phage terminase large subunit-like protein